MSAESGDVARRRLPILAPRRDDVGLVGLFTEGTYGARASVRILMRAARLRAEGRTPGVFMVHFDARDSERNHRRVEELVERLRARGIREVQLDVPWAPELTERLARAGIGTEVLSSELSWNEGPDAPLGELPEIELVGVQGGGIQNVDLNIGQTCSYQARIEDNAAYEGTQSTHRGCAYCLGARANKTLHGPAVEQLRVRLGAFRRELPDLKVVWIPFLETLFDALDAFLALPEARPLVAGIDLAFQSRPDVLLRERAAIERVAARAREAGTRLRLALVGFENFAVRELEILNRGVDPKQLTEAAALLEHWHERPPPGLHVRGFVPSFIVLNPWTRFEDLEHTSRQIRAHGLMSANVERLRIDPDMPLHEKVVAAGLLSAAPVSLEAHPNGYTGETSYAFADPRVAAVSAGFALLKPLAMSDQAALLEAVIDAVQRSPDPAAIGWTAIRDGFLGLRGALAGRPSKEGAQHGVRVTEIERLLGEHGLALGFRAVEPPPRMSELGGHGQSEVRLSVGEPCENRCVPCVWTRRLGMSDDVTLPLTVDVRGARVAIGGREPLARADLPELIAAAKAGGAARVELATNARRLTRPRHLRALADAGLDVMVVKLFGSDPASWDAHARAPGAFAQTLRALALTSLAAPEIALRGLIHPARAPGRRLSDLVALARRIQLPAVRVVVKIANVDLLALGALQDELAALPPSFVIDVEA